MTILEALLLGIVQGLTEFLPVSSSAHLALIEHWLNHDPQNLDQMAFNVVCHLGTLVAVAAVFGRDVTAMLSSRRYAPRILALAGVATAVTGVLGLVFREQFKLMFGDLRSIAAGLIITGLLLFIVERMPGGRRNWRTLPWAGAILIGLAQGAAITPGISRSGATIAVALLVGLRRRWAAEFSFLIAAPTIIGASALELHELWARNGAASFDVVVLCVGGVSAAVVGTAALRLLLRMLRKAQLHWFSIYLWTLGAAILGGTLLNS